MVDVSVIIVNYNTKDILRNCILSIKEQTHDIDYEIIVVDNNSSDGSLEMLQCEFPEVIAIDAKENLGFGKANNLGMQQAAGEYIFLLNSDTILLNNAIKIFYDRANALISDGQNIGVLGAILLDRNLETCHSYGSFITPSMELKEVISKYLRFLKNKDNTKPSKVKNDRNVDYITGADMFLPSKVYRETNGFDSDFFMYCEEVDWQKRMATNGYSRLIINGPQIIHLEGGSDNGTSHLWSPHRLINLYTSRKIYRKKHYSRHELPFIRLILRLLDMPAIILTALLTRKKDYLQLIKLI